MKMREEKKRNICNVISFIFPTDHFFHATKHMK